MDFCLGIVLLCHFVTRSKLRRRTVALQSLMSFFSNWRCDHSIFQKTSVTVVVHDVTIVKAFLTTSMRYKAEQVTCQLRRVLRMTSLTKMWTISFIGFFLIKISNFLEILNKITKSFSILF